MSSRYGIIWDMDGILADSNEYHWAAWQETLTRYGLTLTREQFDATCGMTDADMLPLLYGARLTPAQVVEIGDAKEAAIGGWRDAASSRFPRAPVVVLVWGATLSPSAASSATWKTSPPRCKGWISGHGSIALSPARGWRQQARSCHPFSTPPPGWAWRPTIAGD